MLRSLQGRLAIALAVGLTVLLVLAGTAVFHVLRHEIDRMSDSSLQETAQRLLPLAVADILDRDGESDKQQRITAVRPHEELLTYIVRDQTGKTLLQSHDADPAIFPGNVATGFISTATHRIYTEIVLQGTLSLTIAEPLATRRDAGIQAALAVIRPLFLLIPIGLLGAWLIVRAGLRPVRRFCDSIAGRGQNDLTPLGKASLPAEIAPVADSVNDLMARLARALAAERSFTASSAHELRTPIAAALAQTQRLVAEAKYSPLQDRARNVESTLHTLSRLSEKLMQLARAEDGRVLADTPGDLRPVLALVVDDIRRVARSNELDLALPDQAAVSRMDPDAFAILTRNLVENAVKHGSPACPVHIVLSSDGTLSVTNQGPVLPEDLLTRLTKPFERGPTLAQGSGLGLAIVDALVKGAGARLTIHSPAPGTPDGFQVIVSDLLLRKL